MGENRYGKLLTVILIIVVVAVLGLLIFLGTDIYRKIVNKTEIKEALNKYDNMLNIDKNDIETEGQIGIEDMPENKEEQLPNIEVNPNENIEKPETKPENNNNNNSNNKHKPMQKDGYNVVGKIEIPATKLKSLILEKTTPSSIEKAVAVMYSDNGINQVGNTVIAGHNYRNGDFFGNNDRLKIGDKIYITDNSGKKIKYKIYNIYETSPDDSDFIVRDTKGKREISLTTCTNNSKARLIIWAIEY